MIESCRKLLEKLTIVLGGAASGKSSYAESIVKASGRPMIYIATAQAYDVEMKEKIADHRKARGDGWTTIEAPRDPAAAISAQSKDSVVLLDCATMWLSNILLAEEDLAAASDHLLAALATAPCPVVIVTNEVGAGIVPDNALARRFRNAQGRLNQAMAAQANTVVAVMAGLPLALKGSLPL